MFKCFKICVDESRFITGWYFSVCISMKELWLTWWAREMKDAIGLCFNTLLSPSWHSEVLSKGSYVFILYWVLHIVWLVLRKDSHFMVSHEAPFYCMCLLNWDRFTICPTCHLKVLIYPQFCKYTQKSEEVEMCCMEYIHILNTSRYWSLKFKSWTMYSYKRHLKLKLKNTLLKDRLLINERSEKTPFQMSERHTGCIHAYGFLKQNTRKYLELDYSISLNSRGRH